MRFINPIFHLFFLIIISLDANAFFDDCLDELEDISLSLKKCEVNQKYANECSSDFKKRELKEIECQKDGFSANQIYAARKLGEKKIEGDPYNSPYNMEERNASKMRQFKEERDKKVKIMIDMKKNDELKNYAFYINGEKYPDHQLVSKGEFFTISIYGDKITPIHGKLSTNKNSENTITLDLSSIIEERANHGQSWNCDDDDFRIAYGHVRNMEGIKFSKKFWGNKFGINIENYDCEIEFNYDPKNSISISDRIINKDFVPDMKSFTLFTTQNTISMNDLDLTRSTFDFAIFANNKLMEELVDVSLEDIKIFLFNNNIAFDYSTASKHFFQLSPVFSQRAVKDNTNYFYFDFYPKISSNTNDNFYTIKFKIKNW